MNPHVMTVVIVVGAVVVYLAVAVIIGRFIKAGSHLDPPTPGHTTYQASRRRRP